ncbi:MAG: hypothetical protein O7G87_15530 [bacterium]|nr:hypothetical protein [bacterium]
MAWNIVHVTHEAVQKMGGIGTVLEGLLTAKAYQKAVRRSILVGPLLSPSEEANLSETGRVLFSSISGAGDDRTAQILEPVVRDYNVNLVYGTRVVRGNERAVEAEVLLVDAADLNPRIERNFKFNLYRHLGLESDRYETVDDYLLYLNIAEAAYEAVKRLLKRSSGPHFVLAHEYMGVPVALKAHLDRDPKFRTVFYAHEVSTVRDLIEADAGHDIRIYNLMDRALSLGLSLDDVFGDYSAFYRHALVCQTHHLDAIFAVGDLVVQELHFLDPAFQTSAIQRVYNGVPALQVDWESRSGSRKLLQEYAQNLVGITPDVIFTHVTRPVISKAIWRDFRVLGHLDTMFAAEAMSGVFFILSSGFGQRSEADILSMEAEYGWPVGHQLGAPDLVGPEEDIWRALWEFNRQATAIQAVFVNQFGWDRKSCGKRMPAQMGFENLRLGTDVEFGQSIYEPFGIAALEPLSSGALCVVSSKSGCLGFVDQVAGGAKSRNLVVADYVTLREERDLDSLRELGAAERDWIEGERSWEVASQVMDRLPHSDQDRAALIEEGYKLAKKMSWERVCEDQFLPGLKRLEGIERS